MTGLSAAWWLAREGVDVLVIEKGIVGWEASGRNGGGCTHYQSPLFAEEQRLWPQMDELLGYPTEYRRERVIMALTEAQLAQYQDHGNICARMGYHYETLDAKQTRELVPLAGDNVVGAVHYHFGGQANPQRTVQAYAWALQDKGGRILQHTAVSGIVTSGGKVVGVETSLGRFDCDHLVLAAGPQTGALLETIGIYLPVAPARAEMIVTEPLPLMKIAASMATGSMAARRCAAISPMAAVRMNGRKRHQPSVVSAPRPPRSCCRTCPSGSWSCSRRPPMCASSAAGPASSRTRRTAAR